MPAKEIMIFLSITAVIFGGIIWFSVTLHPDPVGQSFSNQGQTHIAVGESHPAYNSNPPTSGWHYAQPAHWGIYQTELPDERVIHNLEHGGIWISYQNIDADTKSRIEDLAKRYPNKMIVTPRAKDDGKIALASWTRLETFDTFDKGKILEFVKANKNRAPEPLAQ